MFWFQEAAHEAAEHAEEAEHHAPIVVQLVNHWFGEAALQFQLHYTKPVWDKVLGFFGTTPEDAFGPYTAENAIPWYTVMFVIACILSVAIIWILKGKLSESEPGHGQQTLEVSVLAVRNMIEDIIGPHGLMYFPVVMTFAVLILVSNLIRPFSLGIRLFGNLFADEKVLETLSGLAPPYTWFAPILLMPLSAFVALIQTFVFILLSQLYLSEVSHAPHDAHGAHGTEFNQEDEFIAPVLT